VKGTRTNWVTKCGDYSIVGGPNMFGPKEAISKSYAVPKDHISIRVVFKVYLLDSWDNEQFRV